MNDYTPVKAAWKRILKALFFCVLGSIAAAVIAQPGTFIPEQYQNPAITAIVTALLMGIQKWIAEQRKRDSDLAIYEEDIKSGGGPAPKEDPMKRNTVILLVLVLLLATLVAGGCSAPKVQLDQKQAQALALAVNLVTIWSAADTDKNGDLNHAELAAAGLRTLNEIARAYPDKIKWEGRMKTEAGRREFVEALIILYVQYTSPEILPEPTPAPTP
jgi:hypothetical protein